MGRGEKKLIEGEATKEKRRECEGGYGVVGRLDVFILNDKKRVLSLINSKQLCNLKIYRLFAVIFLSGKKEKDA